MSSILGALLSFLLLYKYVALFAFSFGDAVILPLPGNSILLATGAFASQGYFSFWISLATILVGNTAGDCFDYFLAKRYGRSALKKLHVRVPWYIERLEAYFRQHPRRSILFTRFIGSADSVGNLLAGFIGVPFSTFLAWDVLGNLVSNFYVLYLGYLVGVYWTEFSGTLSIVGLVLLVLAVIAAIAIMAGSGKLFGKKSD